MIFVSCRLSHILVDTKSSIKQFTVCQFVTQFLFYNDQTVYTYHKHTTCIVVLYVSLSRWRNVNLVN